MSCDTKDPVGSAIFPSEVLLHFLSQTYSSASGHCLIKWLGQPQKWHKGVSMLLWLARSKGDPFNNKCDVPQCQVMLHDTGDFSKLEQCQATLCELAWWIVMSGEPMQCSKPWAMACGDKRCAWAQEMFYSFVRAQVTFSYLGQCCTMWGDFGHCHVMQGDFGRARAMQGDLGDGMRW